MTDIVPAVVIGAGINGLGVARSLARERVPVWLLDSDRRRAEMHTRAAHAVSVRSLHGEALIEDLTALSQARFSNVRPVLFLTQEECVKTVSQYRDRLSALYRCSLPTDDVLHKLIHKRGFQSVAERLGSPIPSLVHVRSPDELPIIETLHYPVVVKPGEHNTEYGRQFKKAYRVENAAAGADLIRRILSVTPDVVVQEWIEGPDANIYFCLQYLDRRGCLAASFTGRKIRSWPPQVGGTASCVAAPEVHQRLSAMTTQFFQATGVIGMASMEYKRDSRTRDFLMVEPTVGRTDYQEEVATLNGINLPHAAWCSELDLPPPAPATHSRPVVWRVQSENAQSAAAQGQQASQGYPHGSRVVDAFWRWSDPMPSVLQNLRRTRSALRNRALKLMGRPSAAGSKL